MDFDALTRLNQSEIRRKLVIVGEHDSTCGKTCLLIFFERNTPPSPQAGVAKPSVTGIVFSYDEGATRIEIRRFD
jgi:hypothetical protein